MQRSRTLAEKLLPVFHIFERAAERQGHSCFPKIACVVALEPLIQHTARCVLVADAAAGKATDNARRAESDCEVVHITRGNSW